MIYDKADEVIKEIFEKSKKATINPTTDDDKCSQYVAIIALNHEEIGKNSKRK